MTGETKVRGAEEKDIHTVLVVDDHPLFRRGVCELLALEPQLKLSAKPEHAKRLFRLSRGTNRI